MTVKAHDVHLSVRAIFDNLEGWAGTDVQVTKPRPRRWQDKDYADPFGVGLSHLRLNLLTARHHLLSASALLTSKAPTIWGEDVLARASIEASATAFHLATRWDDPKRFLTSATADRVWSLEQRRKLLDGATEAEAQAELARTSDRITAAVNYGIDKGLWKANHDVRTVAKRHNIADRSRELFLATPETSEARAGVFYRYFSGTAHTNPSLLASRNIGSGSVAMFRPTKGELMLALGAATYGLETANRAVSKITGQRLDTASFDVFRTLDAQVQ